MNAEFFKRLLDEFIARDTEQIYRADLSTLTPTLSRLRERVLLFPSPAGGRRARDEGCCAQHSYQVACRLSGLD